MTYLLPLEADLQVVVELDEVEEMLQNRVGLVLRHAYDAAGEVRIHKDRLPARHRVGPMMLLSRLLRIMRVFRYLITG